jgi:hypothetical protein
MKRLTTIVACGLLFPGAGAAAVVDSFQLATYAGPRTWEQVSWIPDAAEKPLSTVRVSVGGRTYVGVWVPATIGWPSTSVTLKHVHARATTRLGPSDAGVFVDRRLTTTERARFTVLADLYREASVMVVATGHPACGGLTTTQARAIARGKVVRWSQVVAGASIDRIKVRHPRGSTGAAVPHFGTDALTHAGRHRYAAGARGAADGGVSAAAKDPSIAAITTWSRVRFGTGGTCVVPLDGIAPSDETVLNLRYPEAFAVSFVVPRRVPARYLKRPERHILQRFMQSARLKKMLTDRGLLVPGIAPTTPGSGSAPAVPAPTTDHLGRPITTTAEASAETALTGLRLDAPTPEGSTRLALDPNGALTRLVFTNGVCSVAATGGWTVKGGWRYPENGGGLIARLGWFLDDANERTVVVPDAEPATAYVDGVAHTRVPGAAATCG